MKKIICVSCVACLVALIGCSQEKEIPELKTSISLYVGEQEQIEVNLPVTWSTDTPFVAEVDDEGVVTANHVGRAEVVASTSTGHTTCVVEVKPRYHTFVEPYYELFGQDGAAVIAKEKRKLVEKSEVELIYEGEVPPISRVSYTLSSDGMVESADVWIMRTHLEEVMDFLGERYNPITQIGNKIVGFSTNYPNSSNLNIRIDKFHTIDMFSLQYKPYVAPE